MTISLLGKSRHAAYNSILFGRRLTQRQPQASCTQSRYSLQISCIAILYSDATTLGTSWAHHVRALFLQDAAQARHCSEPCRRQSRPLPSVRQQVSPVHVPSERERTCRCQQSRLGGRRHLPQRSTPACLQRPQQSFAAAARYHHPSEHVAASCIILKVRKWYMMNNGWCEVQGAHAGMGCRLQSTEA